MAQRPLWKRGCHHRNKNEAVDGSLNLSEAFFQEAAFIGQALPPDRTAAVTPWLMGRMVRKRETNSYVSGLK
jgi:hypothetical protein